MLPLLLHILKGLFQKPVHQSHIGVFRIGANSCQSAHGVGFAEDPHFHGIDRHLGYQSVVVKPADHVRLLHSGELRPDDLSFLPSDRTQLLFRHLEHIPEKSVVLLHIFAAYGFYFQILFIHNTLPRTYSRKQISPTLERRMGPFIRRIIPPVRSVRRYFPYVYTQH